MLPLVNEAFLTLQPYVPGKPVAETERELGITDVVKLASNENPYGPSPKAVAALGGALHDVAEYPDGGAYYLRQALARKHHVDVGDVVVGNGTNEIIEMVIRTFLRPDETMLYTQPSFVMYKIAAQAAGRQVKVVNARADLAHDLAALAKAVDACTKLVFLDNPINPTGRYTTKSELEAFFDDIPDDLLVVLDEAYIEYASAPDFPRAVDYLAKRERLLVSRTFSKCYGLAGLRVGYAVGNRELIEYMNRGRQPFNVSIPAQVAALAALSDQDHVEMSTRLNRREMDRLVPLLRARGLGVTDSQANFVLVDFHRDGEEIFNRLLREGVIVRPLRPYALQTSARITIGTQAQNDRLLSALDRVLG